MALISVAFISLWGNFDTTTLVVIVLVTFASSYLLSYIVLEFLFIKELEKVYHILEQMRGEDYSLLKDDLASKSSPFGRLYDELYSFASTKEREIAELKKLEQFRRDFLADVSHELKTPIFAAQGFVHTLLDGAIKDKTVRTKFLKKAAKSLDALDNLVHDLLTLSQMEAGEIKMHYENFDIYNMCQEIIDELEDKAQKKNISLDFSKDTNPGLMIYGDQRRLYQVMLNLTSNAIKYTEEGGWAKIILKQQDGEAFIGVKDNGVGISNEHAHRVFERFYRVEKSRTKKKGGTGLGLAIVKHVVDGHNSKVQLESKPGEGTLFYFTLPLAKQSEQPQRNKGKKTSNEKV
ncbi:sensor histidine kinase [Mangrovivirga cuniculi]|uniref:sensor histidine kinase n=1 Tax=Mangrovivirga cuniculi TaxID=2715131 RepID=UPI001FE8A33C|nr:ATP-binding protein [Mangrovivirga cuniculi]